MQLKNKKTGKIENWCIDKDIFRTCDSKIQANSLTELNEGWEDVPEEPKEDGLNNVITLVEAYSSHDSVMYPKEIVEKFKAWKRLKDAGFVFEGWKIVANDKPKIYFNVHRKNSDDIVPYLDLLFGGEE